MRHLETTWDCATHLEAMRCRCQQVISRLSLLSHLMPARASRRVLMAQRGLGRGLLLEAGLRDIEEVCASLAALAGAPTGFPCPVLATWRSWRTAQSELEFKRSWVEVLTLAVPRGAVYGDGKFNARKDSAHSFFTRMCLACCTSVLDDGRSDATRRRYMNRMWEGVLLSAYERVSFSSFHVQRGCITFWGILIMLGNALFLPELHACFVRKGVSAPRRLSSSHTLKPHTQLHSLALTLFLTHTYIRSLTLASRVQHP